MGIKNRFFQKKSKEVIEKEEKEKITADLINIKEIKDNLLFSKDNLVFCYLKIEPITTELLSFREKLVLERKLTNELNNSKKPWKILAIPRTLDLSDIIVQYQDRFIQTDDIRIKNLIKDEIIMMESMNINGNITVKQFFFVIWEQEHAVLDLRKRADDLIQGFLRIGLKATLLDNENIIELCNMVTNPKFANFDCGTVEKTIPLLSQN